MKKAIRINEAELKDMISESVSKVLDEGIIDNIRFNQENPQMGIWRKDNRIFTYIGKQLMNMYWMSEKIDDEANRNALRERLISAKDVCDFRVRENNKEMDRLKSQKLGK